MTVAAPGEHELDVDPMLFGPHRRRPGGQAGIAPELLRIGVQFADGAKTTNLGEEEPPPGPVMHPGGGGGGDGDWRQTQWVWPLPPPGPVSFVCEWPAAGIALTRSEIDAQTILDAAGRAQLLFPDQGSAQSAPVASWTSYAPLTAVSKPNPSHRTRRGR